MKEEVLKKHLGSDIKFISPIGLELIYTAMEEYAEHTLKNEIVDAQSQTVARAVRDIRQLQEGMLIRNKLSGKIYVVSMVVHSLLRPPIVIAQQSVQITNESEWEFY